MNTSPEMINEAYQELQNNRSRLLTAAINSADASESLKDAESIAVLNGLEGKNAEQRKAQLRSVTEAEIITADVADRKLDEARYEFEQSSITVDRVKMLMRYDELAASN